MANDFTETIIQLLTSIGDIKADIAELKGELKVINTNKDLVTESLKETVSMLETKLIDLESSVEKRFTEIKSLLSKVDTTGSVKEWYIFLKKLTIAISGLSVLLGIIYSIKNLL